MNNEHDNFIMLPTNDFCFKELMQNAKVRKGFIAALLAKNPEEIEETRLLPTETRRRSSDDKLGILDILVLMSDRTMIDMEMQVDYFEHWHKRTLFYLGKLYTGQIKKGEPYDKLKKCIHVSILDFVLFPNDAKCYRTIHLCDVDSGDIYTDLFELKILELKKLTTNNAFDNQIHSWMKFFSGKTRKEFENMSTENEFLEEAYKELIALSANDEKRWEYEAREKALRDYISQMESATNRGLRKGYEQGHALGLEQGRELGRELGLELAKQVIKMHKAGSSISEIASTCNLSEVEVKELLF